MQIVKAKQIAAVALLALGLTTAVLTPVAFAGDDDSSGSGTGGGGGATDGGSGTGGGGGKQ